MQPNLTPEDYAAIAALLRDTIAADRFPLSPRMPRWKAILDKLEPPAAKREPLPPLKPVGEPSMVVARMRLSARPVPDVPVPILTLIGPVSSRAVSIRGSR